MGRWVLAGLIGTVLFTSAGYEHAGYGQPRPDLMVPTRHLFGREHITIGSPAPNFKLWDLHGNPVSLVNFRGKVVFINFWATWCGPCRVEMPAMEKLYGEFRFKGLEILAVSTDHQGVAVTRPFQQSMGLTFPILHDSDYRVGGIYGARTLPMTFLVDRSGIIRHRIFGARDWHSPEARGLIRTLLSEL